MFTFCRCLADDVPETTDFVFAQSALAASDRQLPDALSRIPANDAETSGVAEQGP